MAELKKWNVLPSFMFSWIFNRKISTCPSSEANMLSPMTKKQRIWNGKNGLAMLNDLRNALIRELDVLFVIKTPISNVGRTRLTLLFAEDV